jgi:protein-S-isoprenylcysteine O-methyltransferase Ste14
MIALALGAVVFAALAGAFIFAAAGRVDLPWVWRFLALHTLLLVIYTFAVPRDLLTERLKPPPEGRVHDHHRKLVLPLILACWILTGLDLGRLHWSDAMPLPLRCVGFAAYTLGMALSIWAVATNRFYSSVIRIQRDRGQHPVTNGPYRMVRHPGYLGTIGAMLGSGLALGSWLGLAPLVLVAVLFIRRTVTEDRLLRRELGGYSDYADRVRFRLVPGCW